MKRLLLPLAALAIAGLLFPSVQPAYACSCVPSTTQASADSAKFIVIGTVAELVFTPPLNPEEPETILDRRTDVVLQVEEYLKGDGPDTLIIREPGFTANYSETGELTFDIVTCSIFGIGSQGTSYLLFLVAESDSLMASFCFGSGQLDHVDPQFLEDVRAAVASPGTLPDTGGTPPTGQPTDGVPWLPIAAGNSLILLAAAAAYVLRRRRAAARRQGPP